MSRSNWKGPFLNKKICKLDKKLLSASYLENDKQKIWSRKSIITSNLIGSIVFVHNGKEFKNFLLVVIKSVINLVNFLLLENIHINKK